MKKRVIRLVEFGIPVCILLVILFYGYYYSTVEIPEDTTIIFSDNDAATAQFEQLVGNSTTFATVHANLYSQYNNHSEIILLGIRNSGVGNIIAELLGEKFDKNRNTATIITEENQRIVIFYSPTQDELLQLLSQATLVQDIEPEEQYPLASVQVIPYDHSSIFGAVAGCTATTWISYSNGIIDNRYQPTKEDYIRLQVYEPFASSSFKNLVSNLGKEAVKEVAKDILEDVAGQELIQIHVSCTTCDMTKDIPMSLTDFTQLEEKMDEWRDMLMQDFCYTCPGSSVAITYDTIDTMEIYGMSVDLNNGEIEPSGVIDKLLGKSEDTYDNLPRSYTYTQTCPDYVPRITISFLLPVFKDWEGMFIEPEYNWQTMRYDFEFQEVGSLSVPISFNPIFFVTPLDVAVYNNQPQYDIYYTARLRSSPAGIISEQEGFYQGLFILVPPTLSYEKDGKKYDFAYWEVNGAVIPQLYLYYTEEPFDAIAHYEFAGNVKDIDLQPTSASFNRFELGYNLTFSLYNNGKNSTSDFYYTVLIDDEAVLTHNYIRDTIAPRSSQQISLFYPVESIFPDYKDKHKISIIVDDEGNILETSESNNEISLIVEREKPNLAIYDHYINVVRGNATYTISFLIKNIGYIDVTNTFYIRLLTDNNRLDEFSYSNGIAAGKNISFTETYDWNDVFQTSSSKTLLEIFTDVSDVVNESYEKDNIAEKTIERQGPDIIVEDVSIRPQSPTKSEQITISVLLKNIGEVTTESGTAEIDYSNGDEDTEQFYQLDPGQETTITFTKTFDDCGKQVFHAIVYDISPQESDIWQNGMYNNEFRISCDTSDATSGNGAETQTGTTCDDVCSGTGTCMGGGCTYSISYHETAGDAWCIAQHDSAYACCCMVG